MCRQKYTENIMLRLQLTYPKILGGKKKPTHGGTDYQVGETFVININYLVRKF